MLRLGDLFSGGVNSLSGGLFLSPIWTGLACAAAILIIIWFVMSKEVEPIYNDTSFMFLLLKAGIWIFIVEVGVLYLSAGALEKQISSEYKNKNQERIINLVTEHDATTVGMVPELTS